MSQYVERRAMDILLRLIAERTAPVVGEEFFRVLVRYLAEGLGVKYAFVAECAGTHTRARWRFGMARVLCGAGLDAPGRGRWCNLWSSWYRSGFAAFWEK